MLPRLSPTAPRVLPESQTYRLLHQFLSALQWSFQIASVGARSAASSRFKTCLRTCQVFTPCALARENAESVSHSGPPDSVGIAPLAVQVRSPARIKYTYRQQDPKPQP